MKYYKLDYNANQPSNKQISVPTDSVYGVAVKIEKAFKKTYRKILQYKRNG